MGVGSDTGDESDGTEGAGSVELLCGGETEDSDSAELLCDEETEGGSNDVAPVLS